jgi:hypothetical protein
MLPKEVYTTSVNLHFKLHFNIDLQLRLRCARDPRTRIAVAIVNQPLEMQSTL